MKKFGWTSQTDRKKYWREKIKQRRTPNKHKKQNEVLVIKEQDDEDVRPLALPCVLPNPTVGLFNIFIQVPFRYSTHA